MDIIDRMIADNDDCLDELDGATVDVAARLVVQSIDALSPTPDQRTALWSDVRDAIRGAAAEIHHDVGGHAVEVEVDGDEMAVTVSGITVAKYDLGLVDLRRAA